MAKHTLSIWTTYDDRSGEVVTTICSDVGSTRLDWVRDERSTPSQLSSVVALSAIEFLLSATSEEAGLISRS